MALFESVTEMIECISDGFVRNISKRGRSIICHYGEKEYYYNPFREVLEEYCNGEKLGDIRFELNDNVIRKLINDEFIPLLREGDLIDLNQYINALL